MDIWGGWVLNQARFCLGVARAHGLGINFDSPAWQCQNGNCVLSFCAALLGPTGLTHTQNISIFNVRNPFSLNLIWIHISVSTDKSISHNQFQLQYNHTTVQFNGLVPTQSSPLLNSNKARWPGGAQCREAHWLSSGTHWTPNSTTTQMETTTMTEQVGQLWRKEALEQDLWGW